ncbi:MAG: O-Antigen polymerase [Betaproteobacteria bacterium]|nr:O-Antigen polymerase [Betaproteobacteria bacterium]
MRLAKLNFLKSPAETGARACVIALGFSIPISVALDNILLGLVLLAWLAAGNYRAKWEAIKVNPVSRPALLLFGLLTLGLAYGERYAGDGLRYWAKYVDLMFVPIFISVFRDKTTREYALKAFGGAMLASIIVSFFSPSGLLIDNPFVPPNSIGYPVGFKYSITQSVLTAFGAFAALVVARETTSRKLRLLLIGLSFVAAFNVLFTVISRTGYVILAALALYFFLVQYRWRGVMVAALGGMVLATAGYFASGVLQQRVDSAIAELHAWQPDERSATSIGIRMDFYRTSLKIVKEHPLFGAGTGSFSAAYAAAANDPETKKAVNPHNEYLLITAQIGLVGLACLIYLFYMQWRYASRLPAFYRDMARGLVLVFAIGCLFNSLLLDHTEGLFFAWATGLLFGELSPERSMESSA